MDGQYMMLGELKIMIQEEKYLALIYFIIVNSILSMKFMIFKFKKFCSLFFFKNIL